MITQESIMNNLRYLRKLTLSNNLLGVSSFLLTSGILFNNPILLSSGKYELSNRQLATKQNMENYMKEKQVVSAYTEYRPVVFINDEGERKFIYVSYIDWKSYCDVQAIAKKHKAAA